jgi:3-oxoacyl-[acyl-carrier-protein] synthase-1
MQMALAQAGIAPDQVGYINLHGTATRLNDAMESQAVHRLFGDKVPCSSTKPLTGHTLGAAGAIEAALACLLLERALPLPTQWVTTADPALAPIRLVSGATRLAAPRVLSNSFAFGGNNVSLLFGRSPS